MSESMKQTGGITRRGFLATTSAIIGMSAIGSTFGCSSIAASGREVVEEEVYSSSCRGNCQNKTCPLDVVVRDGKAVDIRKFSGEETSETLCPKGYMNIERCYSPLRIKYPLRRLGERGSGEWERISWDEAINEICTKWKTLRKEYGNESLLFLKGVANNLSLSGWYSDRLKAYLGASEIPFVYDMNGLVTVPKYSGTTMGAAFSELIEADNIFVWGANPSESGTVIFHYLTEAQSLGAQIVVIDPIFTITASKADKWVQIRPGTDGLLAIAMMKIAVRDGLVDEEFLKNKSQAPFLVKIDDGLFLRQSDLGISIQPESEDEMLVHSSLEEIGPVDSVVEPKIEGSLTVNGKRAKTAYSLLLERLDEWSLDQIAELTEIPLDSIESLAHNFATGRSTIVTGFGIDHYANGHTGYMNMMTMLAVFGQIGKPGTGIEIVSCSCPSAAGPLPFAITMPADAPPTTPVYVPNLYETIMGKGELKQSPQIRAAYICACNPISNMPERQVQIEAFTSLEFLVVADIFMTETTHYADIVLPVSFLFEAPSVSYMGSPYVNLIEQAVKPSYESKSDIEITNLLGCGMGMEDKFSMSEEEYLAACFDNDVAKAMGVSWERLKKEKRIWALAEVPVEGPDGFATPSGRFEFYFENSMPMLDYGQDWDPVYESLPYWEPPLEAWFENDLFKKYPLVFSSERAKYKTHTMFTHAPTLLEIEREPIIQIHPDDASERGIEHGDIVRVFNDRGYVVVKSVLNPGVRRGMIVIDHGWEKDQFIDGHYNDLSSRKSNRVIPNANFFDCLCEVEKVG